MQLNTQANYDRPLAQIPRQTRLSVNPLICCGRCEDQGAYLPRSPVVRDDPHFYLNHCFLCRSCLRRELTHHKVSGNYRNHADVRVKASLKTKAQMSIASNTDNTLVRFAMKRFTGPPMAPECNSEAS